MWTNINNNVVHRVITKLILFSLLINRISCIKIVSLNVPGHVTNGSEVQLSCLYDVGNTPLYSLKWFYRNNNRMDSEDQEFFRYTPREMPEKRVFLLNGFNIDINKSDGGTVYLKDVDERNSGVYTCEIAVEVTFQTVSAESTMIVDIIPVNGASHHKQTKLMDRIIKLLFNLLLISSSLLYFDTVF